MQLRNASIIALKECQQVFADITLIIVGQRPDYAEVDRDVLRMIGIFPRHKDIARVHICVEEIMVKHLCVENFHAMFCQLFHVHTDSFHGFDIANGDAIYALLYHHRTTRQIPVYFRNVESVAVFEIVAQHNRIGCFCDQIKLTMNGAFILTDNLSGAQSLTIFDNGSSHVCQQVHQAYISVYDFPDTRP